MAGRRAWSGWSAIAALLMLVGLAGPARSELKYTTVHKDHPVHGATPKALWSYIVTHPINDPDDGPAIANTTHDHKLTFETKTDGGVCKVSDLTFRWNFVVTLPKAVDQPGMSAATSAMWKEFIDKVSWHEKRRVEIFLECGKAFVPAAEKMTGRFGCGALEKKVRRYVDAQYDICMKKQREFGSKDLPLVWQLRFVKAAGAKLP